MQTFRHLDHYTEIINGVSFDMVFIKGGNVTCGDILDENNQPQILTVPDFWIGETQVTQELWQAITSENPSYFQSPQKPVEQVSWFDIHHKFLGKLNQIAKNNNSPCVYNLPPEPFWEYATAKEMDKFSGRSQNDVAWFVDNTIPCTKFVKLGKPNDFGLYDMEGNVREWTNTVYEKNKHENHINIPNAHNIQNTHFILRGGSWYYYDMWIAFAFRTHCLPNYIDYYNGFRLFSFVSHQ